MMPYFMGYNDYKFGVRNSSVRVAQTAHDAQLAFPHAHDPGWLAVTVSCGVDPLRPPVISNRLHHHGCDSDLEVDCLCCFFFFSATAA